MRKPEGQNRLHCAMLDLAINSIDTGSLHLNQHLVFLWCGNWQICNLHRITNPGILNARCMQQTRRPRTSALPCERSTLQKQIHKTDCKSLLRVLNNWLLKTLAEERGDRILPSVLRSHHRKSNIPQLSLNFQVSMFQLQCPDHAPSNYPFQLQPAL